MRTLLQTLIALLFIGGPLSAQVGVESTFPGDYTIGLNAGWSYQSSDVDATLNGFGVGLTVGKRLAGRPGSVFRLDGRLRFLYARQYGLDRRPTFDLASNNVLNGTQSLDYQNYPASLNQPQGFAYFNHRTDVAELGLEGLIIFNRLRERTGVHLGLYGGLGLDWFRTRTDQADAFGSEYYDLYAGIDRNQSGRRIRQTLRQGLDGTYETIADGNQSSGTLDLMPSVGIELGYQFSPRFRIFGGHRVTFTGEDEFDGQRWDNANNDLYHYTVLGMGFCFGGNTTGGKAPRITVLQPQQNPHSSNTSLTPLRARITNVQSPADVYCRLNGAAVAFDFQGETLQTTLNLRPGRNEVVIIAANAHGKDREDLIIIYGQSGITPPPPPPPPGGNPNLPTVTITQPPQTPYNTSQPQLDLQATIRGVRQGSQVRLRVNNQTINNFTFDPQTGILRARLNLQYRQNEVVVSASNGAGMDQDAVDVFVNDVATPPRVQITQPGTDPYSTDASSLQLRATVDRVASASDVDFYFNGQKTTFFNLNGNQLTANLNLKNGENTVRIVAYNNAGSDQDQVRILANSGGPSNQAPTVSIQAPADNSETSKATTYVQAATQHVSSKGQISVYLNNQPVSNFDFNAANQQVTYTAGLRRGLNRVRIRVQNAYGSDEAEVRVRRTDQLPDPQPPVVNIISPQDGSSTFNPSVRISASIDHITQASDITFQVNGQSNSQFNFVPSSGSFTAQTELQPGNNTLLIKAVNADGSDQDAVRITVTQKLNPPTVVIQTPKDGTTTTSSSMGLTATVQNVNNRSGITVTVNRQQLSNFSYNSQTGRLTSTLQLRPGKNRIQVTARNAAGQAQDDVLVSRNVVQPPSVAITLPRQSGTTVDRATQSFRATVENISSKQQIRLTLNGQAVTNFQFNRGQVSAQLRLRTANNTIRIEVENGDGEDSDQTTINYRAAQPPSVEILKPQNKSVTKAGTARLEARLRNITRRDQITVRVNGKAYGGFSYSKQTVTASLPLRKGLNTLTVEVENSDGSDQDEITVTYQTGPPPPTVRITSPGRPGTTVNSAAYMIKADVTGIRNAQDLTLKLNGAPVKNVRYSSRTGQLTADVTLKEGENQIVLIAQNSAGTDQDDSRITLSVANRPTVTILSISQPASNPMTPNFATSGIEVRVTRIRSQNQIEVTINGEPQSGFDFNARTGILKGDITLTRGTNTLRIVATNRNGSGEATQTITF